MRVHSIQLFLNITLKPTEVRSEVDIRSNCSFTSLAYGKLLSFPFDQVNLDFGHYLINVSVKFIAVFALEIDYGSLGLHVPIVIKISAPFVKLVRA